MSKTPVFDFSSMEKMEKEFAEEEKAEQEANLKQIKERNDKARTIIKQFSEPIITELDGIEFMLKPISVATWDLVEGNKEDPSSQSTVVRQSLLSPKLSDEEFKLLPAGLKYRLFMFLLQDFFLIAGRVTRKDSS
jgi:hypothetical protein